MKNSWKLSILIPCLNERRTIRQAIESAYRAGKASGLKFEVLVADNGSTDGSIEIIRKESIARLINVPVRGYGAALHWGTMLSKGEYVFFADADLSYDFSELKKFTRLIEKNHDLVLGSRLKGKIHKGSMPFLNRYIGTPFLTFLIRVMYGIKVTDCNSGMRLLKRSFYNKLHMRNSGMEWASEILLKTALNGGKYSEVPINFYKDKRKTSPHLLRWADGWRHLKAIVLVKPNILFFPLAFLITVTIFLSKRSFDLTFFSALLSGSLFLSILAAKMLNYAIDKRESRMIKVMNKIPLVSLAILTTLFSFFLLLFIPNKFLGTKLFIISAAVIFNIWVFLIETIKTHLVNTLPEKIK